MAEHRFDHGGQDDGTLTISIARFYGDDYVHLDTGSSTGAHLTAGQARAVAADLIVQAEQLEAAAEFGVRPDQITLRGCGQRGEERA